jgi:Methyltransferase domain
MPDDRRVIVDENRRLVTEVKTLRERVAAFETSRWWRLHPRFAWRRVKTRLQFGATPPRSTEMHRLSNPSTSDHPMTARFREEVVRHGTFSEDWFTLHIPTWEPFLEDLDGRTVRILEIGSYEGLSACFFLWRLREADITCIDTFTGGADYVAYGIDVTDLEGRFDANVALVDSSRIRKLKGDSRQLLMHLVDTEEASFDLVYVDGSHLALDVIIDAALSWQLLRERGIVIFDDYGGAPGGADPLRHVQPAVDAFLNLVVEHAEIPHRGRQVIIRKTT